VSCDWRLANYRDEYAVIIDTNELVDDTTNPVSTTQPQPAIDHCDAHSNQTEDAGVVLSSVIYAVSVRLFIRVGPTTKCGASG